MEIGAPILLVDDDEMSRELLTLLLADRGYTVTHAESGEEALQLLPASNARVVLTDLQMPGLCGSELAQRMRMLAPDAILLAMSGSQPVPETLEGYDHFLLKPFTMDEFAAAATMQTSASKSETKAGVAADGVLDEVIYRKLEGSMPAVQLTQLYTLCLNDAEQRIAAMRSCAAKLDDDGYRKAAHAIKGGCGMLGATELQALAGTMEQEGLAAANHVASLDEFVQASERLRRILIATQTRAL